VRGGAAGRMGREGGRKDGVEKEAMEGWRKGKKVGKEGAGRKEKVGKEKVRREGRGRGKREEGRRRREGPEEKF